MSHLQDHASTSGVGAVAIDELGSMSSYCSRTFLVIFCLDELRRGMTSKSTYFTNLPVRKVDKIRRIHTSLHFRCAKASHLCCGRVR